MKKETKQSNDFKVYMHINKINNKKYIGVTSLELHRRWGYNGEGYLHKNKDGEYTQPLMARAILKYGWDGFDHEVIAEGLTEEEANKLEKSLIDEYKTNDPNFGYNIREGGGASGHLSDETKKKLSKSLTGKFVGDKNPMYGRSGPLSPAWGKKHTKEELQAMSERMKGEKNPMYGKKYTEEERQRIGEISKGKPRSEETKQKISQKNKEYYQTHAHHMTGTHRSDEFKKMMSEKMKGRLFSENTRKKMSENHHDVSFGNNPMAKKVRCIETGEIFSCAKEAAIKYGDKSSSLGEGIRNCCKSKQKASLVNPETGDLLHWEYA